MPVHNGMPYIEEAVASVRRDAVQVETAQPAAGRLAVTK